jgi:hypothetical protein
MCFRLVVAPRQRLSLPGIRLGTRDLPNDENSSLYNDVGNLSSGQGRILPKKESVSYCATGEEYPKSAALSPL